MNRRSEVLVQLLRVSEVAQILGLGRTATYQLVGSGEIPSVRMGKARRVHVDDLNAYIQRLREDTKNREAADGSR